MKKIKRLLACVLTISIIMVCLPLMSVSAELTAADFNVDMSNKRNGFIINVVDSPLDSSEKVIEAVPHRGSNSGFGLLEGGEPFVFETGKKYSLCFEYYYPITDPAGAAISTSLYRTTATGARENGNKTSIDVTTPWVKPTDGWVQCSITIDANWSDNLDQDRLALLFYFDKTKTYNNVYLRNIFIMANEEAFGIDLDNKRGNVVVENNPVNIAEKAVKLEIRSDDRLSYGLREYTGPYVLEDGKSYTVKFKYYYYTGKPNSTKGDMYLYRTTPTGATAVGNKTELVGSGVNLISIDKWQEYEYTFTADLSISPTHNRIALSTYINKSDNLVMADGVYFSDISVSEAIATAGINTNNSNITVEVQKLPNSEASAVMLNARANGNIGFGIMQNNKPVILEDGKTYKVSFDYYVANNVADSGYKDFSLWRTTQTGGTASGNKTDLHKSSHLDSTAGWHSASYTFKVDLTNEPTQKYLWLGLYSSKSNGGVYIKDIKVLVDSEVFGISSESKRGEVEVVNNPTNSSELVLKTQIEYGDRHSYALLDENGEYITIQDGHVYSIKFDYYYYQVLASGQTSSVGDDIWFYRSTLAGSTTTGNKTSIPEGIDIKNDTGWKSVDVKFKANYEIGFDQTYLIMTTMAKQNKVIPPLYIKNLVVTDISMPDNVKSISIDDSSKREYNLNDTITGSDITANVTYTNGTTATVDADKLSIIGFNSKVANESEIIINYGAGTALFTVNVKAPVIAISQSTLTLNLGETKKLTAATTPAGEPVFWESADPHIAAVSPAGEVRPFAPGVVDIKAIVIRNGIDHISICKVTVPDPNADKLTGTVNIGSVVASSLNEIKIPVMVECATAITTLGISELNYDETKLKLISAEWTISTPLLTDWDYERNSGVALFADNTTINGQVMMLTFRALDKKSSFDTHVSFVASAKTTVSNNDIEVIMSVTPSDVTAKFVRGDFDGNFVLDSNDAIYVLYSVLMPESYPLSQFCDFDNDYAITTDDAVYLLYHTLFGDLYPLNDIDTPLVPSVPGIPEGDKDNGFNDWLPL